MRARDMWSTGTPEEPGRYLVAWTHRVLGIDLPRFDYEVHRWDGSEWRTIPYHRTQPDHWRAFISPYQQELEIEDEYNSQRKYKSR